MYQCERLFGTARGREIRQLVEEAGGEACPCKQGRPCPLTGMLDEQRPALVSLLLRSG